MANFQHLLAKPTNSVTRPIPRPAGTYNAIIAEHKFEESKEKKTPYVRFGLSNVSPGADITPESLQYKDGEGVIQTQDLSKYKPHKDFYLTEDSLFRLKDFLETFKDLPVKGRSFGEIIPETKGLPVVITVIQKPSQDGQSFYNEITDIKGA